MNTEIEPTKQAFGLDFVAKIMGDKRVESKFECIVEGLDALLSINHIALEFQSIEQMFIKTLINHEKEFQTFYSNLKEVASVYRVAEQDAVYFVERIAKDTSSLNGTIVKYLNQYVTKDDKDYKNNHTIEDKLEEAKNVIAAIHIFLNDANTRLDKIKTKCIDPFANVSQNLPVLASEANSKALQCKMEKDAVPELVKAKVDTVKVNSQSRLTSTGAITGFTIGSVVATNPVLLIGCIIFGALTGLGVNKLKIEPMIDAKSKQREKLLREKWTLLYEQNYQSWDQAGRVLINVSNEIEKSLESLRYVCNGFEEAIDKADQIQAKDIENTTYFRSFNIELKNWVESLNDLNKSSLHFINEIKSRREQKQKNSQSIYLKF